MRNFTARQKFIAKQAEKPAPKPEPKPAPDYMRARMRARGAGNRKALKGIAEFISKMF